jgi:hypothetical protein
MPGFRHQGVSFWATFTNSWFISSGAIANLSILPEKGTDSHAAWAAYQSFRQRFDIEHMFRFGKQRLLMTQFQTPDVEHEENWIRLVMLAYAQLWAAKDLASYLPRPWERYLEQKNDKIVTPSVVQRDFQTIISEIGKPGHSPKPRGNSKGRVAADSQPKRSKHPVVKKQSKSTPDKQKAA